MTRAVRDRLATHNERVRLFAAFLNALSIGMIGFAVLRPLIEELGAPAGESVLWGGGALAIHAAAHYFLRYLKKEFDE